MINIDFVDTIGSKNEGIHVLVTDFCSDVDLYLNKDKITEVQKESLLHNYFARDFLLYINSVVLNEFVFCDKDEIKLNCPKCNTSYILTKQDYELAFNNYKNDV